MKQIILPLSSYDKTALDLISGFLIESGLKVEVWRDYKALLISVETDQQMTLVKSIVKLPDLKRAISRAYAARLLQYNKLSRPYLNYSRTTNG